MKRTVLTTAALLMVAGAVFGQVPSQNSFVITGPGGVSEYRPAPGETFEITMTIVGPYNQMTAWSAYIDATMPGYMLAPYGAIGEHYGDWDPHSGTWKNPCGWKIPDVIPPWWNSVNPVPLPSGQVGTVADMDAGFFYATTGFAFRAKLIAPAVLTEGMVTMTDRIIGDENFTDTVPAVQGLHIIAEPEESTTPLTWTSFRTHGTAGTFGIVLNAANPGAQPNVEFRQNGIQKLVVTFDKDLLTCGYVGDSAHYVTIAGAGLTVTGQTVSTTTMANDTLTVTFIGCVDRTCYKFDVSNVCRIAGGADTDCYVLPLAGDVNLSRTLNTTDLSFIRAGIGIPPIPGEFDFRRDPNCSGTINTTDLSFVKARIVATTPIGICP